MNYLGMYILTKLDCWHESFMAIGIIGIILTSIGCFVAAMCSDLACGDFKDNFKEYTKLYRLKMWFTTFIVLLILSIFLPTTKQAAFIYIAPQIIENGDVKDTVKNIPELTKLGTDYLKELLKEKINEQ